MLSLINGWFFMINGALLNAFPVINIMSPTNPNPTPKSNNINGTCVRPVTGSFIGPGKTIWKKSNQ